jgi:uncharacterized membrane protein
MELLKIFDMPKTLKTWDDDKMRSLMGTLLRVGVLMAASIAIIGGILFFIQHPKEIIDYSVFKSEPARLRQVHLIINEALYFRGRPIIQLGLLLLIATPVARVVFSLFGFLKEKDWIYSAITFIVLVILFISLFSNYLYF